jgi:hypothetical protein
MCRAHEHVRPDAQYHEEQGLDQHGRDAALPSQGKPEDALTVSGVAGGRLEPVELGQRRVARRCGRSQACT